VRGDPEDVERVSTGLLQETDRLAKQRATADLRASPWATGSFYLAVVIAVVALLLVVGSVLPLWMFPVVVVGVVLLVSVVGAFQLRQDKALSERGFLQLMTMTLRRLRLLWRPGASPREP
jgi:Flp pilus assembly protein TadB